MKMLGRQDILEAHDRTPVVVHVPEWGGDVLVWPMTGLQRDAWELAESQRRTNDVQNIRASLVAACIGDEAGELLMSAADIEALGHKNGAALERIFEVALQLNRIGPRDVEDLVKNSETTLPGDSISA